MRIEEIDARLIFIDQRLSGQIPAREEDLRQFREEKEQLIAERAKLVAEGQRIAEQEQKIAEVDEMELPYDFDAEISVPGLNDIIKKLLKDQYQKLFEEENEREDKIHIDYKEKLRAADDRETQLKRQNEDLQVRLEDVTKQALEKTAESKDFETKLKNAADEIDRLNSHINDLREELANAPAPSASHINITPTKSESLDELVQKAKSYSKKDPDEMVNAFLERQRVKAAHGGRYLVAPELHKTEEPISDKEFRDGLGNVQAESTLGQDNPGSNQVSDDTAEVRGADEPVTRQEFETLKADVEALKNSVKVAA